MNLSRFGSGLMWTIWPSATACQQPNSNIGRAGRGVPLIIYLRLDGGNWSSVATTKRWLIKGCLFRNQNLLLDRLLHLVPIISSSSPSHMLNSARMWELHHIRMHVFLWCTVHLWVCVCVRARECVFNTLCYIMLLFKNECRFVFFAPQLIFYIPANFHPFTFALYLQPNVSTRSCLRWRFSHCLSSLTRKRSGFPRNNNGLCCGFNSCFSLSPKKNLAVWGGTSCFVLASLLLQDLNH